jgi:hypothetical protein
MKSFDAAGLEADAKPRGQAKWSPIQVKRALEAKRSLNLVVDATHDDWFEMPRKPSESEARFRIFVQRTLTAKPHSTRLQLVL